MNTANVQNVYPIEATARGAVALEALSGRKNREFIDDMSTMKNVLFAEDDENDAFLLRRAFEDASGNCRLVHVRDGLEVLNYLQGKESCSQRERNPLPDLLLLDLHMPRFGGLEVLQWLQPRREFNHLPRIILSSSTLAEDMARARSCGANAYYVKPSEFKALVCIVRELRSEWLGFREEECLADWPGITLAPNPEDHLHPRITRPSRSP